MCYFVKNIVIIMRQAILITAYKNIAHLHDVINAFGCEDVKYYIHIDRKSKVDPKQIEKLAKRSEVEIVSREYSVNWGGINHLKAILLLLEKAFRAPNGFDYFHLITGHDYPLMSASESSSYLEENGERDYMEFHKLPYDKWTNGGYTRLSLYNMYDFVDGRVGFGRFFVNKFLALQKLVGIERGLTGVFSSLYGGSTYWSLSRKSINYVFDFLKKDPSFLRRFKYSFCSEEMFFQTIIMNSPLKDNVVNDNLRYIVWEERNGNYPANLDESDYDGIKKTSALFARKFEYPVSEKLLEKLKSRV